MTSRSRLVTPPNFPSRPRRQPDHLPLACHSFRFCHPPIRNDIPMPSSSPMIRHFPIPFPDVLLRSQSSNHQSSSLSLSPCILDGFNQPFWSSPPDAELSPSPSPLVSPTRLQPLPSARTNSITYSRNLPKFAHELAHEFAQRSWIPYIPLSCEFTLLALRNFSSPNLPHPLTFVPFALRIPLPSPIHSSNPTLISTRQSPESGFNLHLHLPCRSLSPTLPILRDPPLPILPYYLANSTLSTFPHQRLDLPNSTTSSCLLCQITHRLHPSPLSSRQCPSLLLPSPPPQFAATSSPDSCLALSGPLAQCPDYLPSTFLPFPPSPPISVVRAPHLPSTALLPLTRDFHHPYPWLRRKSCALPNPLPQNSPPWNSTCRGIHLAGNRPPFSCSGWNSTYRGVPSAAKLTMIPPCLAEFALCQLTPPGDQLHPLCTGAPLPDLLSVPSSRIPLLAPVNASILQWSPNKARCHFADYDNTQSTRQPPPSVLVFSFPSCDQGLASGQSKPLLARFSLPMAPHAPQALSDPTAPTPATRARGRTLPSRPCLTHARELTRSMSVSWPCTPHRPHPSSPSDVPLAPRARPAHPARALRPCPCPARCLSAPTAKCAHHLPGTYSAAFEIDIGLSSPLLWLTCRADTPLRHDPSSIPPRRFAPTPHFKV